MTDHIDPENLKAMEKEYDAALKSPVTDRGVDFLCRARLPMDIGGVDAAPDVIHTPAGHEAASREYRDLDAVKRRELLEEGGPEALARR